MIKRAVLTVSADDSKDYSVSQIEYFNKATKCEMITPYGLFTNVPLEYHMIIFNFNGAEENKAGIGYLHKNRYKNLLPGEVQVGNPFHGNSIKFDNDGNILTNSAANTDLVVGNNYTLTTENDGTITIGGDYIVSITGDGTFSATNFTFSASNEMKLESGALTTFKSTSGGATFLPEAPNSASVSSANCYLNPATGQIQLAASSIRFKTEIKDVQFLTSNVLRLKAKQFKKIPTKNEVNDKIYCGFIAEEVYKEFPQAVTLDKNGAPLAVETMPILMALLEEVKKLRLELDQIKNSL